MVTPKGKYAMAPSIKKTWRDSLPIDMLLSAVSVLVVVQPNLEIPEGLMNYPVLSEWFNLKYRINNSSYKIIKHIRTS
jgi:hypothetical protein